MAQPQAGIKPDWSTCARPLPRLSGGRRLPSRAGANRRGIFLADKERWGGIECTYFDGPQRRRRAGDPHSDPER